MVRLAATIGRAAMIGASSLLVVGVAVGAALALRALLRQQAELEWERQWRGYAQAESSRRET